MPIPHRAIPVKTTARFEPPTRRTARPTATRQGATTRAAKTDRLEIRLTRRVPTMPPTPRRNKVRLVT
jgi:hypothetical protein